MARSGFMWGVVALLGCLWLPIGAEARTGKACTQVYEACKAAGFLPAGDATAGNKIRRNCIKPLLDGAAVPGKGPRALPQVEASILAACNAEEGQDAKPDTAAEKAELYDGRSAGNPPVPAIPLPKGTKARPNIVMILVDDFSMDLMSSKNDVLAQSMPNLARMMQQGATFSNYFVTDSLCCPSRASIFTGMMPHNSGVLSNVGKNGGYDAFMAHKNDARTFAVALHQGFYQTSLMGKYLNAYNQNKDGIPQGWSDWGVASNGYTNFDYVLNVNGILSARKPHLTDELSLMGQDFIARAAGGPFFLELSTFSPHAPFTPPERYADAFPGLTYPKTPAFGARPDANAPEWLQIRPELTKRQIRNFDAIYRKRVQSDKGIDDMIGAVQQKLADLGIADTTYVIFTSDNGFHLGDYSLGTGKMTPFDTDIHVPLVVVGPGIAAGQTVTDIAMNIDLAPTFTDIAGVPPLATFDGHSLLGLMQGGTAPPRAMAVVEHEGNPLDPADPDTEQLAAGDPEPGNPPSYVALRMMDALYVEYLDGTGVVGYYDLKSDPYALHNIAPTLPATRLQALHTAAKAAHTCKGTVQCGAAMANAP